jgi:hypothetical protein
VLVEGVGDAAVWNAAVLPVGGQLVVRTGGALLFVNLQIQDEEAELRPRARTIAQAVLENLPEFPVEEEPEGPPSTEGPAPTQPTVSGCTTVTDQQVADVVKGEVTRTESQGSGTCTWNTIDGVTVLIPAVTQSAKPAELDQIQISTGTDGDNLNQLEKQEVANVGQRAVVFLASHAGAETVNLYAVSFDEELVQITVTSRTGREPTARDTAIALGRLIAGG